MDDRDGVERAPERAEQIGRPRGRSVSPPIVLVVDDDVDHRSVLGLALTAQGYDVAEAEDGNAAIEYLLHNPAPSIILLDLIMPNVSGWDVLSVLRCYLRLRRVPVIVVTGELAALQVPGVAVVGRIQKPVRLVELLELVRRYVKPAEQSVED